MDDIIHDYEYYQAHAKDVNLGDITSDETNARILASLRDDDPYFTYFAIATHRRSLGVLGYFVGRSEKLKTLKIYDIQDNINPNAFLRGLGRNRSIESLHICKDLGESLQELVPFVRNNDSLRELSFDYFNAGLHCARNITLLLRQQSQSSLKSLHFGDIDLDDDGLVELAEALASRPQIEEFSLSSNFVGRNGYVALGSAFEGCLSLRKLQLWGGLIGDEGLDALVEGLKHCRNLTSLTLYGNLDVTEERSRSLSSLFQSDDCKLEHLDLGRMNIGNDGARVLATGLASLPSLKRLYLQDMSIGDQGLQHLAEGLVGCNLKELGLEGNELSESVSGLTLGTLVQRTRNMHWLSLRDSFLTDEGLQSFVEGMANCCSLRRLDLSSNDSITANGLTSLSSLFQAEHCSLCALHLHGINIGDNGAVALANGLIGNKSLTELGFSALGITARGWAAFSTLLCDTSSVSNTYFSNHTLQNIVVGQIEMDDNPTDIVQYLKWNNKMKWNKSLKHAAAIFKILHCHPDIDITLLLEFNLKCLPLVVECFEKTRSHLDEVNESSEVLHCRQLLTVYKFVRGEPLLAAGGYDRGNNRIAPVAIAIIGVGAFTCCLRGWSLKN